MQLPPQYTMPTIKISPNISKIHNQSAGAHSKLVPPAGCFKAKWRLTPTAAAREGDNVAAWTARCDARARDRLERPIASSIVRSSVVGRRGWAGLGFVVLGFVVLWILGSG